MKMKNKSPMLSQTRRYPEKAQSTTQFRIDTSRHCLIGPNGESIQLRFQSLEVFRLLLEHADEVVTKKDILDTVWKGIAVTDDSVTQCIGDIRRALGNEHRSLLQTIPKTGYRLSLGIDKAGYPVIAQYDSQRSEPTDELTAESLNEAHKYLGTPVAEKKLPGRTGWFLIAGVLGLFTLLITYELGTLQQYHEPDSQLVPIRGPSLAVLPFENLGSSTEDSYFSDGITTDIVALLSRYSDLGLVSWSSIPSSFTDNERSKTTIEGPGVRYHVSGSVRHDNLRVRVSVRLTDALDSRVLWSERYDEPLQDVFLVQDRISKEIVTTLAVKLTAFETKLSRNVPTENIAAYQLLLLGRGELRKRTRKANFAARELFENAIDLDPSYAEAHIRLGETYLEDALFGWSERPDKSTDIAIELAHRAIELAGANARSLGFLAKVHVRVGDFGRAQTYLDRAFEFNPNDLSLYEIQGLLHLWNGDATKAIDHLEYVHQYDPESTAVSSHLSTAYYVIGRSDAAVATVERMHETAPDFLFNHLIMTAALVETGEIDSAKAAAEIVLQKYPFITAVGASKIEFFSDEKVKERLVSSLRNVGFD